RGNMNVGGISFTATLLRDERVLVVGGNSLSGVQASAELYDPATGRWTLTGSLRTPRSDHTATLLADGTVLVAGGSNSSGWARDAGLYHPVRGRRLRAGGLSDRRGHGPAHPILHRRRLSARARQPPPSSPTHRSEPGAQPASCPTISRSVRPPFCKTDVCSWPATAQATPTRPRPARGRPPARWSTSASTPPPPPCFPTARSSTSAA